MEKIRKILNTIGLNELETNCYLSLLKKSPQRASDLAREMDTPKATVLSSLYRLSNDLSIIKRAKKKNSYLFLVENPRDLVSYFERKEDELKQNKKAIESALPELRSMQTFDTNKPKIYYFEGRRGMQQAFEQALEEADEIIGYGSNEDDVNYLPKLYPNYYQRRVNKKIPVRAIIPASDFNIRETLKNEVRQLRKTHLIPAEYNFPIQVNIYKNTTAFYSFAENFSLIIKSKPIAQCLKTIFEFAFKGTKEADKKIRTNNV